MTALTEKDKDLQDKTTKSGINMFRIIDECVMLKEST